jgi:alanine racemase
MSLPALSRPSRVHISLKALAANWRLARQAAGPGRQVMAVVKADAYGHGAVAVSLALQAAGCRAYGVAALEEALQLRAAGVRGELLVLGPVDPRAVAEAARARVGLSFWSREYLARSQRVLARHPSLPRLRAHLKVDTGMARLGFCPAEALGALKGFARGAWPCLELASAFTHLACADERRERVTQGQLGAFVSLPWPAGLCLHAANSAALLRYPQARLAMARSGILLYGAAEPSWSLLARQQQPVLSLTTQVVALRRLPKGRGVSYGHTFTTRRPTTVATLAIGYADGLPRSLSNQAEVLLGGRRCRILGRVCMDLCMVDASRVPGVRLGQQAVLLGRQGQEQVTAREWARLAGTIPYEILCGLSPRLPRESAGAGHA